jgi:hypothetical protein
MALPVPPPLPAVPAMASHKGGAGPQETATSVNLKSFAERAQSNLADVLDYLDAVRDWIIARMAEEAAERAAQDAAEVAARTAAVSAEATARTNADTAEATTRANADTGLQNQINALSGTVSSNQSNLQGQINAKANSNSPYLSGNPQADKPAWGDNDNSLATTSWVTDVDAWLQQQIDDRATVGTANNLQSQINGRADWGTTDWLQTQINDLDARLVAAGW